MVKILVTDIDGVLTDGKAYIYRSEEIKSVSYHDLDALTDIRNQGIKIAVVTGEDNEFTSYIYEKINPDFFYSGCKNKRDAVMEIAKEAGTDCESICYIGDGKYDIPALEVSGLSVCPANAIERVKETADIVLKSNGGEGCIDEVFGIIKNINEKVYIIKN